MKKLNCICGKKLSFSCKVSDGDEIWLCPDCGSEYIYNSESDCFYSRDKFDCC